MTAVAVALAVVATFLALALAGVAGAACWWGCAQRRTARRVVVERDAARRQLDLSVSWLTHDVQPIVGEDR